MSRRYWLSIIAIVGLIALTGASDNPAEQSPRKKTNEQAHPIPVTPASTTGAENGAEKYASYPNRYAETCYQSSNHDTADLCAQWRAAYAAENAVKVGIFGAVLSFLGLFFVAISLWQTSKALGFSKQGADAAAKATDATIEANKIAAQVAANQLRAWIAFSGCNIEGVGARGVVEGYVFFIDWKNVGLSPAIETVALISRVGEGAFASGEPNFSTAKNNKVPIPPQQPFNSTVTFTPEQIWDLRNNPVHIRGVVGYKTIFEDLGERFSDITLEIKYVGLQDLNGIRRGGINAKNFIVTPVGMKNRMT